MRVIVGCEFSQIVTKAFRERGHEAYSCDILPCEGGHPEWHWQADIKDVMKIEKFDLGIFHPPCTYLSNVGNRSMKEHHERMVDRKKAFEFCIWIWNLPLEKLCMENPIGYLNTHFRKPDQIIQPYYFGDNEMKTTCLWLRGLPLLYRTSDMEKPAPSGYQKGGKKPGKPLYFTEITNRKNHVEDAKARSRTFPGIADAMAEQWGSL